MASSNSLGLKSIRALAVRIFGLGISYCVSVAIARVYGAGGLGIFAISQMVLMISGTITKAGLDISFLQILSSKPIEENRSFLKSDFLKSTVLIIGIGSLVSLFAWQLVPYLAIEIFEIPNAIEAMRIAVFGIIPFGLYKINSEAVRGLGKSTSYVALDRIWPFLTVLLGVLLLHFLESSIEDVVWLFNLGIGVSLSIAFFQWIKSAQFSKIRLEHRFSYKELFGRAYPMMVTGIMFLVMGWTDKFMLATYLTESEVGQYEVALKLANLATLALFAVNVVVTPQLSRSYQDNDLQKLQSLATTSANLVFVLVLPLVTALVLFSSFFIGMFGDGFDGVQIILFILVFGQLVNSLSGSVMNILQMTGNQTVALRIVIVAALLNVFLNFYLVPTYGMKGAAIATATGVVFWNVASIVMVKRKVGVLALMNPLELRESIYNIFGRNRSNT
jgi:O-antigen/teichoic acid export membrane protein